MSLNTDFTISKLSQRRAIVNWETLNASDVSWLFINGVLKFGPIQFENTERFAEMLFNQALNKDIEIHDFLTNEGEPPSITQRENVKPIITWQHLVDSVRYRVFHTPFGGSEKLITEVIVVDDKNRYVVTVPNNLVDGWHGFRVESVDQFGNQSTRNNWQFLVFELPKPVNDLVISDGSGANLFDFTIS